MQRGASDHAHGVRNGRDAATAHRRRVDDPQQLVAEREVALKRRVERLIRRVGIVEQVEQPHDRDLRGRYVGLRQRLGSAVQMSLKQLETHRGAGVAHRRRLDPLGQQSHVVAAPFKMIGKSLADAVRNAYKRDCRPCHDTSSPPET